MTTDGYLLRYVDKPINTTIVFAVATDVMDIMGACDGHIDLL